MKMGIMASEKEAENSTKALEIGLQSGSPSNLVKQDMGLQMENSSLPYCMPGYKTCAAGQVMAIEGQCLGRKLHSSPEYLQHTIPYVSEFVPVRLWESKPADRDLQTGVKIAGHPKPSVFSSSPSCRLINRGSNSIETKVTDDAKAMSWDSSPHLPTSSSDPPRQTIRPVHKASQVNSGIKSAGTKSFHHSFSNQRQGYFFPRRVYSNSRSNGQPTRINGSYNMNDKHILRRNYEVSCELVRGPRSNRLNGSLNSRGEKDNLNCFIRKNQFNKPDFRIKYHQAKFFMIKSYSEDDIHKSIKYNVWASTPNGNKKLDAAYWDAEVKSKEKDSKCPIFLFFSVNASGQFVGLAEMNGPVDFKKTMDFWQQDKWNGFFPVTWHIIKDIPNRLFQGITLENNDNQPVTFSRDTQEIMLPQGLRMLHIFKSYPIGTSILHDFDFYENREKSLHAVRNHRPAFPNSEADVNDDSLFLEHLEAGVTKMDLSAGPKRTSSHPKSLLVTPPRNLLVNNLGPQKRS